ncbi:MAG: TIM44-like domain-containing protein, partial [Pseudomonadota bacterium]
FERIVAWNPHPDMLPKLGAVAEELGLPFEAVSAKELGAQADVIITITSAFEPLLIKDWIKPGTHIACMGTDTKGKQEVDAALVAAATVFTDEIAQSISIGEAQHAIAAGDITEGDITPIGAVINGTHAGRTSEAEITLRFSGELSSTVRDKGGDIIEAESSPLKRTRDSWTFARRMGGDDPNWMLVATGG